MRNVFNIKISASFKKRSLAIFLLFSLSWSLTGFAEANYLYYNADDAWNYFSNRVNVPALKTGSDITLPATGGHLYFGSGTDDYLMLQDVTSASNMFELKQDNVIKMVVQGSTGNVGIGTISPASRLHVIGANGSGTVNAPEVLTVVGGLGGTDGSTGYKGGGISLTAGNGNGGSMQGGYGGDVSITAGNSGGAAGPGGVGGTVYIRSGAAASAMTPQNSGDIKLIAANAPASTPGSYRGGNIYLDAGSPGNGVTGNILFSTVNTSGKVGIGTNIPLAKLNIFEGSGIVHGPSQGSMILDHNNNGGASSIVFRSKTNIGSDYGYIQYQDASTVGGGGESARLILGTSNDTDDHLILSPTGNVGIGTLNPGAYKVDVTGQINASAGLCIGGSCRTSWTSGQGLLDTSSWTISSGSIGQFVENGSSGENQRVWFTDPFGRPAMVWKGVSNGANDASGGWDSAAMTINPNKSYRSMVWIMKPTINTGSVYLGCDGNNTLNLNNSANDNPYFFSFGAGELIPGRWYLLVGYIHANNDSSTTNYSAMYDGVTGQKIKSGTDYKNGTGSTQIHRTYNYYDTVNGSVQYFWGPRFEEVNGTEPSIEAILSGGANKLLTNGTNKVKNGGFGAGYDGSVSSKGWGLSVISGSVNSISVWDSADWTLRDGDNGTYGSTLDINITTNGSQYSVYSDFFTVTAGRIHTFQGLLANHRMSTLKLKVVTYQADKTTPIKTYTGSFQNNNGVLSEDCPDGYSGGRTVGGYCHMQGSFTPGETEKYARVEIQGSGYTSSDNGHAFVDQVSVTEGSQPVTWSRNAWDVLSNGNVSNYTGNVGIGVDPSIKLAIFDNDTGLDSVADGQLNVLSNNVTTMSFRNDLVGIGTTNPGTKLEVYNGSLKVNGGTASITAPDATQDYTLELYQPYSAAKPVRLRFHQGSVDWGRIELFQGEFHFKTGDPASDTYLGVAASAFRYASDRSLKKNIATIESPLTKILKLRGVTFSWKHNNKASVGLIAQEVEKVFPELVSESNGLKSVEYGNLVAPLIEAVKEQQKEINNLKNRIELLENKK